MLLCSYLLAWKKIVSFHQFKIPHGKSSASVHLKADVETQKRKGFFLGLILSYTMGATSHTSFKLYMEEPCHFTISWFIWAEMNALQLKWFAAKWMFRVLSQIVYYRHVFNFSSLPNYRVLFTFIYSSGKNLYRSKFNNFLTLFPHVTSWTRGSAPRGLN